MPGWPYLIEVPRLFRAPLPSLISKQAKGRKPSQDQQKIAGPSGRSGCYTVRGTPEVVRL